MVKILLVEDDNDINNLVKKLLIDNHYEVISAYSGTECLLVLENEEPDLILLDLMLPGISGEEIIAKFNNIPIIVLSAKESVFDKVNNLLNGAIDYITKPFSNAELLARIQVILRRKIVTPKVQLIYKNLRLDTNLPYLYIEDKKIKLTKTEYAILKQLIINQNKVLSKNNLLALIENDTFDGDDASIKVHISNLNRKIKDYTGIKYIEAIWGIGYKLKD